MFTTIMICTFGVIGVLCLLIFWAIAGWGLMSKYAHRSGWYDVEEYQPTIWEYLLGAVLMGPLLWVPLFLWWLFGMK